MIFFDTHPQQVLSTPFDVIEGWFYSGARAFSARLAGTPASIHPMARPDLDGSAYGFRIYVDLPATQLDAEATETSLSICDAGGQQIHSVQFRLAPGLAGSLAEARAARGRKRSWILSNIRVNHSEPPPCDTSGVCGALNFLNGACGFSGKLGDKTDGVSAHPYPSKLEALLDDERSSSPSFMALDFGAGLKKVQRSDVVYHEVFDYPSTDILALGQDLPFADGVFDAVTTLAVLEHVDDPFACAKEIMRVLKPGGLLYSGLPFLQPEHGYPDHFFNATRQGHVRLYGDNIDLKAQFVDDHQHPVLSLQWVLRSYMLGLSESARVKLGGLRVEEILAFRYWSSRQDPIVADLSQAAQFELASATTLVARKRSTPR